MERSGSEVVVASAGEVVVVWNDEVPSIAAVLATVRSNVARIERLLRSHRGQEVAPPAAINARDRLRDDLVVGAGVSTRVGHRVARSEVTGRARS
jgi:hypothetical protein